MEVDQSSIVSRPEWMGVAAAISCVSAAGVVAAAKIQTTLSFLFVFNYSR